MEEGTKRSSVQLMISIHIEKIIKIKYIYTFKNKADSYINEIESKIFHECVWNRRKDLCKHPPGPAPSWHQRSQSVLPLISSPAPGPGPPGEVGATVEEGVRKKMWSKNRSSRLPQSSFPKAGGSDQSRGFEPMGWTCHG